LAIAHIGQGAALDHAQCVFKVGTLGVSGQVSTQSSDSAVLKV
jgi:hypothetical protein